MSRIFRRRQAASGGHSRRESAQGSRRRLVKRIALASAGAVVAVVLVVAGGGYFLANHLLSSIHRIPNITALDAVNQPVMPAASRHSMTVLLTGSRIVPTHIGGRGTLGSSTAPEDGSGLIALVHLNSGGHAGAVVNIPTDSIVTIPGHGRREIWRALTLGGPSLLIRTVELLTNVRIQHYSVLSLQGAVHVVNALNGVEVDVPHQVRSLGHTFHKGMNLLKGGDVLPYVRQPLVTEVTRTLLQQNLIRTMLDKIAHQRLFASPSVDYRELKAMSGALSVDSNFSNSQIESLALDLGYLHGKDGTFVSAPVVTPPAGHRITNSTQLRKVLCGKLWDAIRHDAVAAYARRYPFTVTPGAPG